MPSAHYLQSRIRHVRLCRRRQVVFRWHNTLMQYGVVMKKDSVFWDVSWPGGGTVTKWLSGRQRRAVGGVAVTRLDAQWWTSKTARLAVAALSSTHTAQSLLLTSSLHVCHRRSHQPLRPTALPSHFYILRNMRTHLITSHLVQLHFSLFFFILFYYSLFWVVRKTKLA